MMSYNNSYRDLELQREEIVRRRKLIEQKVQEQSKILKELEQTQQSSYQRLIQRYEEQKRQARQRNQSYLEEISMLTASVQLQKDLLKIKNQSSRGDPNSKSSCSAADYLMKAKKNYELHFENLLPLYYREQTQQMEDQYKKLQVAKIQTKHRHELLKQELAKEQAMKARLFQQKQELLQILTLEQKDLMESKIRDLLLREENKMIEQELRDYLGREGYRIESQVKEELNHFDPSEMVSLPHYAGTSFERKRDSSEPTLPFDYHLPSKSLPSPSKSKSKESSNPSGPSQTDDQVISTDAKAHLEELKRSAMISMKQNSPPSQTFPSSKQEQPTSGDAFIARYVDEEELKLNLPESNPQIQKLPSKHQLTSLTTDSTENFFTVSNSTPASPIYRQQQYIPNQAVSTDFEAIETSSKIPVYKQTDYPTFKKSETVVPEISSSSTVNKPGTDEFDVIEDSKSSASVLVSEESHPGDESKQSNQLQFQDNDSGIAKTKELDRKVDVNQIPVDSLNKLLNNCYQYIESQLGTVKELKAIYRWTPDLPYQSTKELLHSLCQSIDVTTNSEIWESIAVEQKKLVNVGQVVLYVISEKGPQLIPSNVMEGVVTLEKVRKELKKINGMLMLFDNMIHHLKLTITSKISWLEDLTSCFTAALVLHVPEDSKDRMTRKVYKLLQLGIIPETEQTVTTSAPSPYRKLAPVAAPALAIHSNPDWMAETEESNTLTFNVGKGKPSSTAVQPALIAPILKQTEVSKVAELELDEIEDDEQFEKPPALKDLDSVTRSTINTIASKNVSNRDSGNVQKGGDDADEFDF